MIQEIRDKAQWNEFLLAQPTQAGIFLQSWEWGEFQARLGRKVWRLGITQGITRKDTNNNTKVHELVGVCGIVKHELPMGRSYLYSPRGPILGISNFQSPISNQIPNQLVEYVRNFAQKEKAIFWRYEPLATLNKVANEFRRSLKFVRKEIVDYQTHPVQPTQTLVVGLTRSEDELLAAMHEKTRYNIRLADRKGIRVKTGSFDEFWKLLKTTSRRDRFATHPRSYYEKMLKVLDNGGTMRVRLHAAYFENKPVAGAIVGYFGDTATYLHGASSYSHRALMGPYALHWHIIREAKKDGYKFYDFWGIQTDSGTHKPADGNWNGITRFKTGFGGNIRNYPGTFDLPLNNLWYALYRVTRYLV